MFDETLQVKIHVDLDMQNDFIYTCEHLCLRRKRFVGAAQQILSVHMHHHHQLGWVCDSKARVCVI